ncbi:MAG: alanine racemase domain-containing protein, partial [bacterium]
AAAVARRAGVIHKQQRVLIQVNCSGEPQKSGCRPGEAMALAQQIIAQPELALEGLMTIGPLDESPEAARPAFQQCRALRDEMARSLNVSLPNLSMGMTGDLEVAIEEGATLIRLGSALFGHRPER